MKPITQCILALVLIFSVSIFAEIAAPPEPVGNATDTPKAEPPPKRRKKKLTPKERAHLLSHKKAAKKKAKRKLASPQKPKAKP